MQQTSTAKKTDSIAKSSINTKSDVPKVQISAAKKSDADTIAVPTKGSKDGKLETKVHGVLMLIKLVFSLYDISSL